MAAGLDESVGGGVSGLGNPANKLDVGEAKLALAPPAERIEDPGRARIEVVNEHSAVRLNRIGRVHVWMGQS